MSIYIKTLTGRTVTLELGTFKNVNTAAAEALGVDARDLVLIRPDEEDGHVLPNPQPSNRRLWWITQFGPERWWNIQPVLQPASSRPVIPLADGEVLHAMLQHSYQVALEEDRIEAVGGEWVELHLTFKLSNEDKLLREESFQINVDMKDGTFEDYRDVLSAIQENVMPCCADLQLSLHEIGRITISLDEELLRIERRCKMIS